MGVAEAAELLGDFHWNNSHGLSKDLSRAKFWYKSAYMNKITSTGMKQAREHLIERLNLLDHGSVEDYLETVN